MLFQTSATEFIKIVLLLKRLKKIAPCLFVPRAKGHGGTHLL
jgi:hypothetical protein